MAEPQASARFSWARLAKGGATENENAKLEALELARALAAQTIVLERDAVIEELPDRFRAIAETIWPSTPLQGYQLHSSLGAYAIAKVAWGWTPAGAKGFRHEPLDRDGLLEDLLEQGVPRDRALAVLGDWQSIDSGFTPDSMGLDVSRIAGLAESSLTRRERGRALSQVAYSARDLSRLASTISVLSVLRLVLPVLTPEQMGPRVLTALIALALQRPDRALELLGDTPDTLAERTITEIAAVLEDLSRGLRPRLDDDAAILAPELEERDLSQSTVTPAAESTDDVLEIVEEKVDHKKGGGTVDLFRASASRTPRPARWDATGLPPQGIEASELEAYVAAAQRSHGPVSRKGLLGLRLAPAAPNVLAVSIPPDERLVRYLAVADSADSTQRAPAALMHALDKNKLCGSPLDAVFPPVRGALRAIMAAMSGRGPSDVALKDAGDLRWVMLRARALARIVGGELEAAVDAVRGLPYAPEGTWASDRLKRFRKGVRARDEEARELAVHLIADLGHQLGRTLAGTVPDSLERMR